MNPIRATVETSEWPKRWILSAVLSAAVLGAIWAAPKAQAELYKWTDDKGKVHYGDRMPPEYANRSSTTLNRQGVTVKRTSAALTPEQIRQREEQAAQERDAARAAAEQRRMDMALLNSYVSEQEIEVVKKRALKQIEQSIEAAMAELGAMRQKRAKLEASKAAADATTALPEKLAREIDMVDREIERQLAAIEARKKDGEQVSAKFEGDKQRYREAKARQAELAARVTTQTGQAPAPRRSN